MSPRQHGLGPTRAKVLDLLQTAPEPQSVIEVAEALGMHKNSARFHLDALAEAGYANRATYSSGHQGRPALKYSATNSAPTMTNLHLLELTGALLQYFVTPAENGHELAIKAGREWGAMLTQGEPNPTDAPAALAEHLRQRGMGTSLEEGKMCFHSCPFRNVIQPEQLPSICAMHQGLIQGYLETTDSGLEITELEVGPEICVATLGETSA